MKRMRIFSKTSPVQLYWWVNDLGGSYVELKFESVFDQIKFEKEHPQFKNLAE